MPGCATITLIPNQYWPGLSASVPVERNFEHTAVFSSRTTVAQAYFPMTLISILKQLGSRFDRGGPLELAKHIRWFLYVMHDQLVENRSKKETLAMVARKR